MSVDYNFIHIDVDVEFKSVEEKNDALKNFNARLKKYNMDAAELGEATLPLVAETPGYGQNPERCLNIRCESDSESYVDEEQAAILITECFPCASGEIGYAWATTSYGGYCRECGGGHVKIDNGRYEYVS